MGSLLFKGWTSFSMLLSFVIEIFYCIWEKHLSKMAILKAVKFHALES